MESEEDIVEVDDEAFTYSMNRASRKTPLQKKRKSINSSSLPQTHKKLINHRNTVLSDKKWTHERKLLLLSCRLRLENDFVSKLKKPLVLWQRVLEEIKDTECDFPFSRDDVYRKFLNFMVTYKRIKKRNTSGQFETAWEYFDMMDEVYKTRSDIIGPQVAPVEYLDCSISDLTDKLTNDSCTTRPQSREQQPKIQMPSKCEMLDLLKHESAEDRLLVQELIDLEKKKLKVERDKVEVERQKVEEIKKLRVLLMSHIE